MGKVQLKMAPPFASMLGVKNYDWLTVEKNIGEGTTVRDLLAELASSHAEFRKTAFNPETGKISNQVMLILNDSFMHFTDVTEARLNDGDSIVMIPVYDGG
jgi:molybdopterin converting factor small subunit